MLRFLVSVISAAFRFIVLIVVLELIWRAIKRLLNSGPRQKYPNRNSTDSSSNVITGQMIRDPVCGMHIAAELAIKGIARGNPVYFCSEECRQKYLSAHSR